MMAYLLSRPRMAFIAVYLVMAVGIGFIVELEPSQPPEDRAIQPRSIAVDLVTVAVQASQ
ncbi:MAG TPA: hypothetical protein VJU77_04895 [Chthoniobacterales bacterium]|nr:hypothetical protein [Chthoniobacterales bacterium]